jgi:hypothetical protein
MKGRRERSSRPAQREECHRREVHNTKGGSHTNGGIALCQRLSTTPRNASDTGLDQAGLREAGKGHVGTDGDPSLPDGRERKPALPILRQINNLAAKPQPTMGDSHPT